MKKYHYILSLIILPVCNILIYGLVEGSFTNPEFIKASGMCFLFWAVFTILLALSYRRFRPEKIHPFIVVDITQPPVPPLPKTFKRNGEETWMSKRLSDEYRAYLERYHEKLNLYQKEVQDQFNDSAAVQ